MSGNTSAPVQVEAYRSALVGVSALAVDVLHDLLFVADAGAAALFVSSQRGEWYANVHL